MDAHKIGLAPSDIIRSGDFGVRDIDHGGLPPEEDSENLKKWLNLPFEWNVTTIAIGAAILLSLIVCVVTCVACCKRKSSKRKMLKARVGAQ